MKTKLCDVCRATGLRVDYCEHCDGSGYTSSCPACKGFTLSLSDILNTKGSVCAVCAGSGVVSSDEDFPTSAVCERCHGAAHEPCLVCLGGGVVLESGRPLPRLCANQQPAQV